MEVQIDLLEAAMNYLHLFLHKSGYDDGYVVFQHAEELKNMQLEGAMGFGVLGEPRGFNSIS